MTTEEHQAMKRHLLESESETIWNGIVRNFTYSNVSALGIWIWVAMGSTDWNILLWVKIFGITASIFFSGWIAERLWFQRMSSRYEKPFSAPAYLSRVPIHFILCGIFFDLALFLGGFMSPVEGFLFLFTGGTIGCLVQVPLQWFLFNRLRKLSLINL